NSRKVAGPSPRPGPWGASWLADRPQPRLRGRESQAVAGNPLGPYRHDPGGIHFQCAADNTIIRETAQDAAAFQAWLSLVLKPFIEDLMEKDLGPYGGNGSPWHDACVGLVQHPCCHDPR